MNNRILLTGALLCIAATMGAQTPEQHLREDISRAGGNHHTYEYTDLSETPAPKGYKAFYISHYGRHGSRSDTKSTTCDRLYEKLREAQQKGLLSPHGEELLNEVGLVKDAMKGMDGHLTFVGGREHQGIARRMAARYPSVFRKGGNIRAESSTVQRCIVSMGNFTTALGQQYPDLDFTLITGDPYMSIIGPARSMKNEDKDRFKKFMVDICSRCITSYNDTTAILSIFKDAAAGREFLGNKVEALQGSVYSAASFVQDFGLGDKADIYRFLPFNYIRMQGLNNSLYIFANKGNSVEFRPKIKVMDRPLVKDLIEKADKVIADGGYVADLRFGHDYPLLDFVSTLQISGVGDRLTMEEAAVRFESWRDICMGSNLQAIFYRNKKGEILVKFLYNEKERTINGLEPLTGPYYRWDDVKAFYSELVN